MKSPFPGMDPYIEERGLFEDFHAKLISEIERELSRLVPDRYVVRTPERPYVVLAEAEGKKEHVFIPDIGIVSREKSPPPDLGGIALAGPNGEADGISMRAFITTEYRETIVEIYLTEPEHALVTCIEVLSPSNKRRNSPGWDIYLRKRQALLMGAANFVELDLLRTGDKMPMLDPWPASPYTLLVARKLHAPHCRVWPAHFHRPLAPIPVPLNHPDSDVRLDLQPMIDAVYQRSRYYRDIDYKCALTPPLNESESAWLAEQMRQLP